MPRWFQVWLDTAVKEMYMNIQWRVVMKSERSVQSPFLDWVYLCCAELVDCADGEKWETLYALTGLKFCPTLLMVCLTADGDVTVCALMEAILVWQSSGDLLVWGGHWWATGQRNDPSVNTKQTLSSWSNNRIQNDAVKKETCLNQTIFIYRQLASGPTRPLLMLKAHVNTLCWCSWFVKGML